MKQQPPPSDDLANAGAASTGNEGVTLKDLADASGISERTIRFYIVNGLLLGADVAGPQARYPEENLSRLKGISLAQDAGWQLARVREWFERGAPDDESPRPKPRDPATGPTRLSSNSKAAPKEQQAPLPFFERRRPDSSKASNAAVEAEAVDDDEHRGIGASLLTRSSWQRIELEPGVELHVRRPSTTASNRRVRKLLSFAKSLGTDPDADADLDGRRNGN